MIDEIVDDRIKQFLEKMHEHFGCTEDAFKQFFKPRKADFYFLAYDVDYKIYAYSHNAEEWFKSGVGKFEYHGHVTIPARGSIWKLRKNKTVYMVTDFANIANRKSNDILPCVVYMNERGESFTLPVVYWHTEMEYSGKKLK